MLLPPIDSLHVSMLSGRDSVCDHVYRHYRGASWQQCRRDTRPRCHVCSCLVGERPSLDTIVHNSRVLFASHCLLSRNQIVQWFADIAVW